MGGKIGATLALDGEKEFTRAIKSASTSLKELDSEMKLTSEQSRGQANTLATLQQKHDLLQRTLDKQTQKSSAINSMLQSQTDKYQRAGEKLEKYKTELAEAREKLEQMKSSGTATNEELAEQEKKVATLEQETQKAAIAYQNAGDGVSKWKKQLNDSDTQVEKLSGELRENDKYLDEAAASADGCATSIDNYGKQVEEASTSTDGFNKSIAETVNVQAITTAISNLGRHMSDLSNQVIETGASFDTAMSNVGAISGASADDMTRLTDKAAEMGKTTKFSASEAADAMGYMAMAGWKVNDILDGTAGVMNLAAASGTDLATTSDIVTDALTAFGKSAADSNELANIMAATSSNANTNVSMMGESFKNVASTAGSLGYSMQDVSLAIGLMANSGVKGGEAGTALKSTLVNLAKPSKQCKEAMDDLGISMTDSQGNMKSLDTLMGDLRTAFAGLTEKQKAQYAASLAGKTGMAGLNAILNASEADYQKLSEAIQSSNDGMGAAATMASTMSDNYEGDVAIMKSAWEGFTNTIWNSARGPARQGVQTITSIIGTMTSALEKAPAPVQDFVGGLTVVAQVGGQMAPVLSEGVQMINAMKQAHALAAIAANTMTAAETTGIVATEGATAAQLALNVALAACPYVLAATAIVGVVGALAYFASGARDAASEEDLANQKFQETIDKTREAQQAVETSAEQLDGVFDGLDDSLGSVEARAEIADELVGQLEAIDSQTVITTEDQARMKAIIAELQELYPNLSIAIDETTGHLKTATSEVKNYIDEEKKTALLSVYQDQIKEAAEKLVNAKRALREGNEQLEESEKALNEAMEMQESSASKVTSALQAAQDAREKYNDLLASGKASQEELTEAENEAISAENEYQSVLNATNGTATQTADNISNLKERHEELKESVEKLESKCNTANDQLNSVAQEMSELEKQVTTGTEATEEHSKAVDTTSESLNALGDAAEDAADDISSVTGETIKSLEELYTEAVKDIGGTKDVFKDYSDESTVSIDDINKALDSQIQYFENYSTNIQTAMSDARYGTDETYTAMVNSIAAMGTDGAAYMQAFVDEIGNEGGRLDETLGKFGQSQDAQMGLANSLSTINYNAQFKIDEINSNLEASGATISATGEKIGASAVTSMATAFATGAVDIVGSLASGIVDNSGEVESSAEEVGQTGATALDNKKGEYNKSGTNSADQFVKGIGSKVGAARSKAGSLGSAALSGLKQHVAGATGAGSQYGSNFVSGLSSGGSGAYGTGSGISGNAVSGLNAGAGGALSAGQNVGNHFLVGLNQYLTQAIHSAQNTASQINHALAQANSGKKSINQAGKSYAEQFAEGMREGLPTIERAYSEITSIATNRNIYPQSAVDRPQTVGYVQEVATVNDNGVATAEQFNRIVSILEQYLPETARKQIVLNNGKLVGEMQYGMDSNDRRREVAFG